MRLSNRLGFYERVLVGGGETRQELHSSFVFIEYSTDHLHHLASSAITSSGVYDLSLSLSVWTVYTRVCKHLQSAEVSFGLQTF